MILSIRKMSSLRKYKKVKYLGKGSYGAAILVELKSDPSKTFVIKEIVIGHLKPAEQQAAKNEAEVLHQMSHSNITMYIESFVENSKLYIVMEHADGGDLSSAIQKRKTDSKYYVEDEVMRIFVQICLALKHVHSANILHRDLKSQNIFLTLTGVVKLGDFGIAKVLDTTDDQARTQIGTPYYLSPEICESKPYGRKSDIWSLGVLLYEIVALEMPFQANSLPALVHKICSGEPNYVKAESKYSPTLITLTKTMLNKLPDKRPTVQQIVKTDFIKCHISRLLSYTLKVGNGGVSSAPVEATKAGNEKLTQAQIGKSIDVEEVEKHLEKAIIQQRDQPRHVDNVKDAERLQQLNREEESRKLKKFQQDQLNKKKLQQQGEEDDASVGSVKGGAVIVKPAPVVNRQPIDDRGSRSPIQQQRKQDMSERGNSNNSNNDAYGAAPRQVSKSLAEIQQEARLANMRSNAAAGGNSINMELQQQQRRYGVGSSNYNQYNNGNIISGNYNQKETNSSRSVASTNSTASTNNDAARREYFANRAAAQAVKARVESYERGGNILGGNVVTTPPPNDNCGNPPSSAGGNKNMVVVASNNNYNNMRRHSNDSTAVPPYATESDYDPESRIAQLKAQKERDRDRELAQKEFELKQAMEQNRQERRRMAELSSRNKASVAFDIDISSSNNSSHSNHHPPKDNDAKKGNHSQQGDDVSSMPAIASTKSNSENRKQWNSNSSISSSSSGGSESKPSRDKGVALSRLDTVADAENEDDTDMTMKADYFNSPNQGHSNSKKKGWGPPVMPSDVKIAKGIVARSSARDKDRDITPTRMFSNNSGKGTSVDDNDSVCVGGKAGGVHSNDQESVEDGSEREYVDDADVMRRLEIKRLSQIDARNQAKGVLKKLREKKKMDLEVKQPGADSDSKKLPSIGQRGLNQHLQPKPVRRAMDDKPSLINRLEGVLSSVEAATESVQKALQVGFTPAVRVDREAAPKDRDGSQSVDEKAKCLSPPRDVEHKSNNQRGSPAKQERADSKQQMLQADVAGDEVEGGEEEDDLQNTIDTWLNKQKRGVTRRKKWQQPTADRYSLMSGRGNAHSVSNSNMDPSAGEGGGEPMTYITIEEELNVMAAAGRGAAATQVAHEVDDEDDFDDDPMDNDNDVEADIDDNSSEISGVGVRVTVDRGRDRGVYLGNDVEVVGLQCMLAKALMGDEDDDDDDDGNGVDLGDMKDYKDG